MYILNLREQLRASEVLEVVYRRPFEYSLYMNTREPSSLCH